MLVSILIPTLIERLDKFTYLIKKIQKQIDDNNLNNKVQIISHMDNRTIPLSYKRNLMQKNTKGKYFMHLDDDDDVSDDYCVSVCEAIENLQTDVDVITYDQISYVNTDVFYVKCDLHQDFNLRYIGYENSRKVHLRYPWQWCLWNSKRFRHVYRTDSDTNAREDQNWLKRIQLEYPKSQFNIPKILHQYNYQDAAMSTCQ